jgi:hypothetical protein
MSVSPESQSTDLVRDVAATHVLEYQTAIEQYQHCTTLRRQDLAFVTTAQGAALTIIGKDLLRLDLGSIVLSVVAFLLLLLGLNSERRLAAYMKGYLARALEIESAYDLRILRRGAAEVQRRRALLSNSIMFPVYYVLFACAWLLIWSLNVLA